MRTESELVLKSRRVVPAGCSAPASSFYFRSGQPRLAIWLTAAINW